MSGAFYNENDPKAAAWLRELIRAGLIADGEVDDRSIADVRPADLRGYDQCHFFAGIGGWSYSLRLAGWPDTRPVWTGSCPCQPFSVAGQRKGFDDDRHLWPVWRDLIAECRPSTILGEQTANAAAWLRLVRGDLERLGFAVGAIPIEAASAGAYHKRDRYWFVADAATPAEWRRGICGPGEGADEAHQRAPDQLAGSCAGGHVADADLPGSREERQSRGGKLGGAGGVAQLGHVGRAKNKHGNVRQEGAPIAPSSAGGWIVCADGKARRLPEPGIRLLVDGATARVAKLRGLGNAIDPRPAAAFIRAVM